MKGKRIVIVLVLLLGTSLISFIAGRIVEATRYQYQIIEYRNDLKAAKQQLAIYQSELTSLRNDAGIDPSSDLSTMDWSRALNGIK